MAHLWVQSDQIPNGLSPAAWCVMPLDGARVVLPGQPATLTAEPFEADALMRSGDNWVVIGSSSIRINGLPLHTGIRALADRDELLIEGRRSFFSTEVLAAVVLFPGSDGSVCCPRCQQVIEADTPAVKCPQCGVWHHQSDRLPCWTYGETCTLCDQRADLDASYRWTPEEL